MTSIKYTVVQDWPKKGVRFIDLTPSMEDYTVLNDTVNQLYNQTFTVDYIISPDARGFIWGSAVALKAIMEGEKVGFIPVRKKGKLPNPGASYEYETEYSTETLEIPMIDLTGKRCFFVDDVYATGGTYEAIKHLVIEAGGILLGGVVIYDVGIKERPLDLYSLYKGDDLK